MRLKHVSEARLKQIAGFFADIGFNWGVGQALTPDEDSFSFLYLEFEGESKCVCVALEAEQEIVYIIEDSANMFIEEVRVAFRDGCRLRLVCHSSLSDFAGSLGKVLGYLDLN